jgi:hypothetical protein
MAPFDAGAVDLRPTLLLPGIQATAMHPDPEIHQIKQRIAAVHAQRERLKRALENGDLSPRVGFAQLEAIDQTLSSLDSRYKHLWDAARMRSSSSMP